MTDYREAVRSVLDGLLAIPVPVDVNIEDWTQFVEERQELIEELGFLVDAAPTLVQGLLMNDFADDLAQAMNRVQPGVSNIQLEMRSLSQEMETARKSSVLVRQHQQNKAEPGVLLGVG
tara:strand:- start:966 stop:1322 length:357 start_codon:yes stop_codon:yes gene_type:complete